MAGSTAVVGKWGVGRSSRVQCSKIHGSATLAGLGVVGGLESCAPPPLLLSASLGRRSGHCGHHLHCSCGSAASVCSRSPPSAVHLCGKFSSVSVYWTQAPLWACECFTGCRMNGRDKGSLSLHHVTDAQNGSFKQKLGYVALLLETPYT